MQNRLTPPLAAFFFSSCSFVLFVSSWFSSAFHHETYERDSIDTAERKIGGAARIRTGYCAVANQPITSTTTSLVPLLPL